MSDRSLRRNRISDGKEPDQRNPFERDRDRILYTHAFRRLAGVTQVARANESYTYHDRLSHSLKVAQIGRRLAEYCLDDDGPYVPEKVDVNPDVVETAALAHDIGHPPFGHAAEQELHQKINQDRGVDEGFEGNAQSFRVVTRLCVNTPNSGLDLTFASLNALIKYPWENGSSLNSWGENESDKWGVYTSDLEAFREVRKLSSVDKRRSAEADIMDWADDLAYAVHDMEDFYKAGIIPLDQLLSGNTQERSEFVDSWADQNDKNSRDGYDILDYLESKSGETLRTPYSGTEAERYELKQLSSDLINRYLGFEGGGIEFQCHNDRKHYMQIEEYLENEVSLLKYMTRYYVINDAGLAAQQRGQRKVIGDLFDILYNSTLPSNSSDSENVEIVPNRFQKKARELMKSGDRKQRCRFAADVITSMTEKQATEMHKRLVGDTPGSLQDRIFH